MAAQTTTRADAAPQPGKMSTRRQIEILALIVFVIGGLWAIQRVGSSADPLEESCVMNGLGAGDCTFTNKSFVPEQVCWHITVKRYLGSDGPGTADSAALCSGWLWPKSSVEQHFTVPDVSSMCSPTEGEQSWKDVCSFDFVHIE